MHQNPSLSVISLPNDFYLSPYELYEQCVSESEYAPFFDVVSELLERETGFGDVLKRIAAQDIEHVVHLLHITMFMTRHLNATSEAVDVLTPVTDAVTQLLRDTSLETALRLLPTTITDVLTSHPVDMDRGLVVTYKQDIVSIARQWVQKKELYTITSDPNAALSLRAELNLLHRDLTNTIMMLLHTSNYRIVKIKPESEQRHLSRSIKSVEALIVSHWSKLVSIVQYLCLQHIIRQSDLGKSYQHEAYSDTSVRALTSLPQVQEHPLFSTIMNLPKTLRYQLETWRADMDGNPFVNADTMAQSTAYGRKRSFERLSADDAVIRYTPDTEQFRNSEAQIKELLEACRVSGTPSWSRYIQERLAERWEPVQIYSGLAYFRMVEMTEAAELFSRNPSQLEMLKEGYDTAETFLAFTQPLEEIETLSHIKNGFWQTSRDWVKLRQLSLGLPHFRKGESFHVELIDQYCAYTCPNVFSTGSFALAPAEEQREFLETFSCKDTRHLEANELYMNYKNMIQLEPNATLVQSDSGDTLSSIYDSILLLKAVSQLIGHRGKMAVLCENEASMRSAIDMMLSPPSSTCFDSVIMMCAGSDNQKKLGPFYSAYLNHMFMKTAAKQGINSFFGVGDSPLRSSTHTPRCDMKTFQPGSRKHFFNNQHLHAYLSDRLATQITRALELSHDESSIHDLIFQCFSESMYQSYKANISTQKELHSEILSIAEIVTTYFSRPSKKQQRKDAVLESIRAIDSARAQLILNTFDPQLSGFQAGIEHFFDAMSSKNIGQSTIESFFNSTHEGRSILATLAYYADMLDDALPTPTTLRTVSSQDIQNAYRRLSGKIYQPKLDSQLRLARSVWQHVTNTPELEPHKAQTLMLFGANWMV